MKRLYCFLLCTIIFHSLIQAQTPGEWTWISGDNTGGQAPVFGVQGVPDPLNKPGAIYEGCEWIDNAGNFWMYGGLDYLFSTEADMWKYSPSTDEWTWVNGPGGTGGTPVYGTRGVAAPTNHPGERGYGMLSWVDNNGDFWMYGGYTNLSALFLGDFWKYEPGTNMWTWMGGDTLPGSIGNHGTMGVPSALNVPPPSTENASSWVLGNELWFFGGMSQGGPYVGDLWRYNITTDEWTWMKGDTTMGAPAVYGTKGVSSPTNFPGARICYSRWQDNNDDFWIFGGTSITGTTNDVWKYTLATNEWTWMNGPNVSNDMGSYGTKCVADPTNRPPARTEARACWTDDCGIFWLFGGNATNGMSNDLWRYDTATDMWTWVSGSSVGNATGVYGTKGVSAPTNSPGSRQGSHAYKDANGYLWLFAGYEQGGSMINDLWRYVPDLTCGGCAMVPIPIFTAPNHVCPGTCTNFINNSIGATSYVWSFQGANPSVSTDENPTNICYNVPGTYQVSLIASNSNTSDTLTLNNYITVYPFPPPQGILQYGDTLFANQGSMFYQWFYNGNAIPGATDYYYIAPQSGNYNVVATDENGCEVEAVINDVIASLSQPLSKGDGVRLFPNPVTNHLEIKNLDAGINYDISIYNDIGMLVQQMKISKGSGKTSLDVSGYAQGIYWLELFDGNNISRLKFKKN